MSVHVDTRRLPPAERFDFWTATLGVQGMPVRFDARDNTAVVAGLTGSVLGAVHAVEGFGGNHVYYRMAAQIKAADPDCLTLLLPAAGTPIVDQDGRQAVVANGAMAFIDTSRPSVIVMQQPFRWQLIAIPKSALRLSTTQLRSIAAVTIPGFSGVGRVVQEATRTMISQSELLEKDPEVETVGAHAIDLIATLIRFAFQLDVSVHSKSAVLRESVLTFIRRSHADPTLSPTVIAHAHGVSLRTLHGAFAAGRSLMDTLRTVRLDLSRTDLGNPRLDHWSIAQIAHAHGFPSASDFSRAFRAGHGISPREYREKHLPPKPL